MYHKGTIANSICSLVIISLSVSVLSANDANYKLVITPKNKDACINQIVNFTCSLTDPVHRSQNASIGFVIFIDKYFEPANVTDVYEVNGTLAVYKYRVLPGPEYRYIRCYYGNSHSSNLVNSSISTITAYSMPDPVRNISCMVYNYVESMTCTWSNPKVPEIHFKWRDARRRHYTQNCSELTADGETWTCILYNTSHAGDYSMKKISTRLTLSRPKCGKIVSSDFPIDTKAIVKPAPVDAVQAVVLNNTCILLKWNISGSRPEYGKRHLINISSEWKYWKKELNTEKNRLFAQETICGLNPATEYKFEVSLKPENKGFRSDPRFIVAKTFSARPRTSPLVTSGGYFWKPADCENNQKERDVYLIWKPVAREDQNGDKFSVGAVIVSGTHNITVDWPGNAAFGNIQIPCWTANNAYIFARNINGTSSTSSEIKIPSASIGEHVPKFIMEVSYSGNVSDLVNVSLLDTDDESQYGYTLFWCRNIHGRCNSTHPVKWKHFNGKDILLDIEHASENLYGVSANFPTGGSGFEWQSCIYASNVDPTLKPGNVYVEPEHLALVVTWDKITCTQREPFIRNYSVEYCLVSENSSCREMMVSATGNSRVVLHHLEPDREYAITVRGVTNDQRRGPRSNTVNGVPTEESEKSDTWKLAMVISISFVIGIILIICIALCVKRRYQQLRERNAIRDPFSADSVDNGIPKKSLDDRLSSGSHSIKGNLELGKGSIDSAYDANTSPDSKQDDTENVALLWDTPRKSDVSQLSESFNNIKTDKNGICNTSDTTGTMVCKSPCFLAGPKSVSETITDRFMNKVKLECSTECCCHVPIVDAPVDYMKALEDGPSVKTPVNIEGYSMCKQPTEINEITKCNVNFSLINLPTPTELRETTHGNSSETNICSSMCISNTSENTATAEITSSTENTEPFRDTEMLTATETSGVKATTEDTDTTEATEPSEETETSENTENSADTETSEDMETTEDTETLEVLNMNDDSKTMKGKLGVAYNEYTGDKNAVRKSVSYTENKIGRCRDKVTENINEDKYKRIFSDINSNTSSKTDPSEMNGILPTPHCFTYNTSLHFDNKPYTQIPDLPFRGMSQVETLDQYDSSETWSNLSSEGFDCSSDENFIQRLLETTKLQPTLIVSTFSGPVKISRDIEKSSHP